LRWPQRAEFCAAGFVKPAAEIGAAQILGAIGCRAVHRQGREARLPKRGRYSCTIERQVHGIARLGVRHAKREHRVGRLAVAGAAQRNARVGEGAQV